MRTSPLRIPPLLTAAVLLAPAALALPPASLAPPLPSVASLLPLSALENGGFEAGLPGWTNWHPTRPVLLTSPGAAGTAKGIVSPNYDTGSFLVQAIEPPAAAGQSLLLDFHAKVPPTPSATMPSIVEALANWSPAAGVGEATVVVGLGTASVRFAVWGGPPSVVALPADGAWHHYQVLMAGALGLGVLLIDGEERATAQGDPASVDPANVLIVGDVSGCDCHSGPAPAVAYDEFYLGPAV